MLRVHHTQGGAAIKFLWRLPWARSYALSGRTFGKSSNFMIHSRKARNFVYFVEENDKKQPSFAKQQSISFATRCSSAPENIFWLHQPPGGRLLPFYGNLRRTATNVAFPYISGDAVTVSRGTTVISFLTESIPGSKRSIEATRSRWRSVSTVPDTIATRFWTSRSICGRRS